MICILILDFADLCLGTVGTLIMFEQTLQIYCQTLQTYLQVLLIDVPISQFLFKLFRLMPWFFSIAFKLLLLIFRICRAKFSFCRLMFRL